MCYLFSLFWEGSSNKTIPSISRVSYFPLATLLYPRLSSSLILPIFSPNLPSSSRQQIEAVPVPLRFGSSYLLALKSSSLSRAGRRQIGGDSERKASVSNPGGKGLRGFLHPKLGAFAYLLNRNRLLLCGKARSCPQIRV